MKWFRGTRGRRRRTGRRRSRVNRVAGSQSSAGSAWPGLNMVPAPRRACPLCNPHLFDGGLDLAPAIELCVRHAVHPLARFFNSDNPSTRNENPFGFPVVLDKDLSPWTIVFRQPQPPRRPAGHLSAD